ncbi:hypothetical protein AgCh_031884 [Apium graveolens]
MYIQILKNGPFIPMERVDESINGDMVILAHFAPKDPSKYTEPEKEKVSLDSGLQLILIESLENVMYNNIVNYDTTKHIWDKIEILCEGIKELRSNQRRILVSQYEGFMAKPKEGITECLVVNDSEASEDEQDAQAPVIHDVEQKNKGPQKQVVLDLEEDEFYTLDELDEMGQSMVYLARKFSNISVKSQGKAYIVEGKSWDDTDEEDENGELGNYALMALEQGESSSLKSEKIEIEKQELELQLVELEIVKQENEYLNNKLKCASEIEVVLREKLEKSKVKLKPFRNASQLVGQYHEKKKPYANIAIGLDYDALNSNKKNESDKGKAITNQDVPVMLRKVDAPLFKACEDNFSEVELVIKQELADEDNEKKNEETTLIPEIKKKNSVYKTTIKEIKTENAEKRKKNMNGKI